MTPIIRQKPDFMLEQGESPDCWAIVDLTKRQVEILIGALGTVDAAQLPQDGYSLYSSLYDEARNLDIEVNPYKIGTKAGPDPTERMDRVLDLIREIHSRVETQEKQA